MEWKFQRVETQFEGIPVGEHRIRIAEVNKKVSKNGNDMLEIIFDVSGYSARLWHYIVFMDEHPEITNRNLTQLFDSFGIEDNNFNIASWVGKVGGCMTKEDEYGAKVRYFLNKKKQENLPPWKDADKNGSSEKPKMEMTPVDDSDLPF